MPPKHSPLQRSSGRAILYRRPTSVTNEGVPRACFCTGSGLDVLEFHTLYSLSSSSGSACSERAFCSWGALRGLRHDQKTSQTSRQIWCVTCQCEKNIPLIGNILSCADERVITTKQSQLVTKRQFSLHGLLPRPPMDQTTLRETYFG